MLGNHDVAQVMGNEITKDGHGVCKAFSQGLAETFGEAANEVAAAVNEFLLSLSLAVRLGEELLITHSLPSPQRMELAGVAIFEAAGYADADLRRGGAAYEWTWGRGQTPEQLDDLSRKLNVKFFIIGHRHCEAGFQMVPARGISIASDAEHACILRLPAGASVTADNVQQYLTPIAALSK